MRYYVLASDYDGTLAHAGQVSNETMSALKRLLATRRKLILVTGRELDDLLSILPNIALFDWVVAENGALLYHPATKEVKLLAEPPSAKFVAELQQRGVDPVSVGRSIVATVRPHETTVLQVIREQGLELQVIFNKESVMVLPAGVNKATGLAAALKQMGLSTHEVVGVGDAENDHAFLSICECSAAVANALPAIKERTDLVLQGIDGAGVVELIDRIIDNDLSPLQGKLSRHHLLFGKDADGKEVRLPPYGESLLIAGPSGSGKSTTTTSFLERLAEHRYQFCIIDPEGDYEKLDFAVTLGNGRHEPAVEEVLQLLADPTKNVVVNMVGVRLADRSGYFLKLLPQLLELRARTGRPHWLVVDEAHHVLPTSWELGSFAFPTDLERTAFITVHPGEINTVALRCVGSVIAVGATPAKTIESYCQALGKEPPKIGTLDLDAGEVLLWRMATGEAPRRIHVIPSRTERQRHTRKYAEGELPPDRSFYFRGPEQKLNLRAQNLLLFLQLSDGVDDQTWLHHLGQGDYSRWFRKGIKDDALATETEAIEQKPGISAAESRALIRQAVERRYTLPAKPS
jgi:HAD superfamily hydrolase (TIGR01484 family)